MAASEALRDVHVVLRDGSTAHVRPAVPADAPLLKAFFAGLSPDSRWLRFFSLGVDLDRAAERAAAGDRPDGYGLVVTTGVPERVVAHANFEVESRGRAEVAFAVADELHGRGMATVLLAHLAQVADARGIATFVAYVLPDNRRMIGVFRDSGFPVDVHAEPDELVIELPTALGDDARARFEDRDRRAAVAGVRRLLRPRTVAVIGASRREEAVGGAVLRHILAGGFQGELHAVNPHAEIVGSRRAYGSVADVPGPVDLAVIAVPAAAVPEVARACAAKGVGGLVVLSGGFADGGSEGLARRDELLAACRAGGMRLLGPNALGVIETDPGVRLTATVTRAEAPAGRISLASQSAAFGVTAIDGMARRGLGLSSFVSFGDKADLSGNDLLRYWEQDPRTDVVLLYLESFGNPRKFARVARRTARSKPVLVVKPGRTAAGARASASRTGALLAAADATVDALFAQAGVIRCDGLDDLLDAAAVLAEEPRPASGRVAIVSNAGGPGIVCADACDAAGLEVVPGSLVDLGSEARGADYEAALACVDAGAVIALFVEPRAARGAEVAAALASAAPGLRGRGIPLVAVFMGPAPPPALTVPAFGAPEAAARALGRAAAYARWRAAAPELPARPEGIDADDAAAVIAAALARGGGWLEPEQTARLLGAYGVRPAEARRVETPHAAGRAAAELGGPVAVKAVAPGLERQADAGGVALDLPGPAAARRAAKEIAAAFAERGQPLDGFQVQRMVAPGVELVLGVIGEGAFGPVVALGAGGPAAELLGDVEVRLAPLAPAEAAAMIRALRTFPLLDGFRGGPRADLVALEALVVRVAALADDDPAVAEVELSPLVAAPTAPSWSTRGCASARPRPARRSPRSGAEARASPSGGRRDRPRRASMVARWPWTSSPSRSSRSAGRSPTGSRSAAAGAACAGGASCGPCCASRPAGAPTG